MQRYGDARIAMVGFPSVGKSTMLSRLTSTHSAQASYEFTTLTCIPGVVHYRGSRLQLLDLPGIIEGASEGKGRGRQVIAVAKSSDLILMVLDAAKNDAHKEILTRELEAVGIRLNKVCSQCCCTLNRATSDACDTVRTGAAANHDQEEEDGRHQLFQHSAADAHGREAGHQHPARRVV